MISTIVHKWCPMGNLKCVHTSGYHCLLQSISLSILIWVTRSNLLRPRRAENPAAIKTAGKVMVGMKGAEEGEGPKDNNKRQRKERLYLWRRVRQSLRHRSPWGTEWHSGKGLGLFAGRCLAGRIPQSAGDSSAWQKPLLKCPHCVSGKQEKDRVRENKTGHHVPLCLAHTQTQTGTSHLIQCHVHSLHRQTGCVDTCTIIEEEWLE